MDFEDSRTAAAGRKRLRQVDVDEDVPIPVESPSSFEEDDARTSKRPRLSLQSAASLPDHEDPSKGHVDSHGSPSLTVYESGLANGSPLSKEVAVTEMSGNFKKPAVEVSMVDRIARLHKSFTHGVPIDIKALRRSETAVVARFVPAMNANTKPRKGFRLGKGKKRKYKEEEAIVQYLSRPVTEGLTAVTSQQNEGDIAVVAIYKDRPHAEEAAEFLRLQPHPDPGSFEGFVGLRASALMTWKSCKLPKGQQKLEFDGARFSLKEWRQCPETERLTAFIRQYGAEEDRRGQTADRDKATHSFTKPANKSPENQMQDIIHVHSEGDDPDSIESERNRLRSQHTSVSEPDHLPGEPVNDDPYTPVWRSFNRPGFVSKELKRLYNISCYNCGASQHWGDDCPRSGPIPLLQSYTFSLKESSRYLLPLAQSAQRQQRSVDETPRLQNSHIIFEEPSNRDGTNRAVPGASHAAVLPPPPLRRAPGQEEPLPGGSRWTAAKPEAFQPQSYGYSDRSQTSNSDHRHVVRQARDSRDYEVYGHQDRHQAYSRH